LSRSIRQPTALAVIGGLLFSTVLSLVFGPAMFMMMDDVGNLFWRFGKKLIISSGETEHSKPDLKVDHKPPTTIVHSRSRRARLSRIYKCHARMRMIQ
jgi:hypothetical protein